MYKILLADDEGIVIDSLTFMIQKEFGEECQIKSAKTGRSVIELAESFRPDIAFMDIQMPGINGIEAIREIRGFSTHIQFIVMSAYDKFDYAKEAINLGVLEYLNKPADKTTIMAALKKAMSIIDDERKKRSEDLIIKEKMETVVPIIQNGLIQDLLFREYFDENIDNFKNLLGLQEDYAYMAVIVCGEELIGNYLTGAVPASIKLSNMYKDIRIVAEDFFPGIVGSAMANKVPIMVPNANAKLTYNERTEIIEKARRLAEKLTERFDITFRVGIGSVMPLRKMPDSYNEAINVLVQSTAKVAHIDDAPMICEYEDDYPIDVETDLFDALEKGNVEDTVKFANQFFDWMENTQKDYINDVRLKTLEFGLWADHVAYKLAGLTYRFRGRTAYLTEVSEASDMAYLRSWFVDKFSKNAIAIARKNEQQSMTVIQRAKQYIVENYSRDLSLDDVSREVDISPYYFSKIFKEEVGSSFIEYMTTLRMEEAKRLLKESVLSMKEICVKIGYSDPNYFSRNFKKYTGVTPTEFKEG